MLLEPGDSTLAQERVREPRNRVRPWRRQLFDRGQRRGHTKAGRAVNREENVGRAAPQRQRQELDDLGRKPFRPDGTVRERPRGARFATPGTIKLPDTSYRVTTFRDHGCS